MTTATAPDGLLLLDKPAGVTSHDVVLAARRAMRERRVGHAGTLDPFATGLLVLLVGRATRLLPYLATDPKVYDATIAFGSETDTEDPMGAVTRTAALPTLASLLEAARELTGAVQQVPPAYSAKRVGGRRAYALARRGADPQLESVSVRVDQWENLERRGSDVAVEEWDVRITCGGGTYVRALARDAGRLAGSAAHLRALRRIQSGPFHVAAADTLQTLAEGRARRRPALDAVPHLTRVALTPVELAAIVRGIDVAATGDGDRAALVNAASGVLVALADRRGDRWQPRVVMRRADRADDE